MKTVLAMNLLAKLIMVDVSVWDRSENKYRDLLITVDTGASVTTISTDILHTLGYDTTQGNEQKIITASSVEFVKETTIDKIKLGDFELENVQVYAHTFPESSFSLGLIGLNVLKEFDVNFLFSNKTIELTPIDDRNSKR